MDEPYINPPSGSLDIWRKDNVWATLMAGGAGIELYIGGGRDIKQQDLREYEVYYKTIATALNFLKKQVPFWQLEPDDHFLSNAWTLKKDGEFYLIYFKDGGSADVNLPPGAYQISWFDPRNGKLHDGSVTNLAGGSLKSLGNPPNNADMDWACIVVK